MCSTHLGKQKIYISPGTLLPYSCIIVKIAIVSSMSHRASLATARGIHLWNCWTVVCMKCIILYSSGNKITTTTTIISALNVQAFEVSFRHNHVLPIDNEANLRDLIVATGPVILLKLVQIVDFSARVILKSEGWPRKSIVHLFYITISLVHHFKTLGEFKLELLTENAQFGSKSVNFLSRMIFKFGGWPWKTIGHLFHATLSFVHLFKAICESKLELQSGNAQFGSKSAIFCPVWPWNLIDDLEKQQAPLLCCFKLCASFYSILWIQT